MSSIQYRTPRAQTLMMAMLLCLLAASPLAAQRGPVPAEDRPTQQELRDRLGELADVYEPLEEAFELASELVRPSVVAVASVRTLRQRTPFGGGEFEDFFERFFGERGEPPRRRAQGIGSGLVIDDAGHILTNNHVIHEADELTVRFFDGREFEATVVGTDEHTDLAVIKIDAENLPEAMAAARLGDSDAVRVGQFVLAIGSPFGLEQTVTSGVVSSKGRAIGLTRYEDFIQTDTAINQGNSGGPLINLRGDVVGINTAILSRTGGHQGIGLAISSNMARYVAESLIETGRVVRGWLGIEMQPLTPELAQTFGYDSRDGTVVANVMPDSPAEAGGLASGDIITAINGDAVTDARDMQMRVARLRPDQEVTFTVWRDERQQEITVRIGEMPEDFAAAPAPRQQEADPAIGLQLADLTPELRERFGVPGDVQGVVIADVASGSPAQEAGLRPGHLILDIGGRVPANAAEAAQMIREGAPEGVRLRVRIGDRTQFVMLRQE